MSISDFAFSRSCSAPAPVGLRVDELYRRHRAAVQARCRRMLGDGDAAEDAAQEIFLRLQRHLPQVSDADEALRWMYRVATNYCLNQIRDQRLRTARSVDLAVASAPHDLANTLVHRMVARWVLSKVPARVREIAWLHYIHGLPQQEVADHLGLSRRTVVSGVADFERRARRLLAAPPNTRRGRRRRAVSAAPRCTEGGDRTCRYQSATGTC